MSEKTSGETKTGSGKSAFSKIIIIAIVIIAVIVSSYFYIQHQKDQKLLKNPTLVAAEETKSLVAKVSNIIELPKGEDPTVATVSDKSKLADQPFFANAQNGDRVLIYTKAKKAILYRPSTNKIIEVAPINNTVSQSSASASASKSASTPTSTPAPKIAKTVKVAIYNGTKIAGLANSYEKQLTDKVASIEVVKKGNTKGDYTSNLVIDLTGKNSEIAKQIAAALDGKVGELPE